MTSVTHKSCGHALRGIYLRGTKGHDANFKQILPTKMAELVAQGLFEPWEGTYRITKRGKAVLAKLEAKP